MDSTALVNTLIDAFPFEPTSAQVEALHAMASFFDDESAEAVFVLKGYAGTGKTTLIGALVKSIAKLRYKTVLMAPTGRAAKVMAAYANRAACTIHKRIYFTQQERQGNLKFKLQKNKFKRTLFLVDEASMIANQQQQSKLFENGSLLHDLITYVRSGEDCKLMFVGDTAQLPPVHTTLSPALDANVLSLTYNLAPQEVELDEVVRQGKDSGILFNATRIRQQLLNNQTEHFQFILAKFPDIIRLQDGYEIQDALETSFREVGREETACIVRSNKRANGYNQQIRSQILGKEPDLATGDLLMVVKNNYHWLEPTSGPGFIANGDTVEVLKIKAIKELYDFRFAEVSVRMLDYPDEEPFDTVFLLDTLASETHALSFEENTKLYQAVREDYAHLPQYKQYLNVKKNPFFNALQVKYAYAFTCHKAQGGQWKRVLVEKPYMPDGLDAGFFRWLYTAVTRASEQLFLVGFDDSFFDADWFDYFCPMRIIAVIPARYEAQRFPGKLLADLAGKTVLQRTYEAVQQTKLFDEVWVATDSDAIARHIKTIGGQVYRSQLVHDCGSNRVAECAEQLDADVIINVQGDEPFISTQALSDLINAFKQDSEGSIDLASLMIPIANKEDIENPNVVKVVSDNQGRALYFSRAAIPFMRAPGKAFRHVGIYAFRKAALLDFYAQAPTPLEQAEKIEAIRYLEMGKVMQMLKTDFVGVGIDTPEDLVKAAALLG